MKLIQCSELCSLSNRSSLLDFLKDDLLISKSQIKKYLSNKDLKINVNLKQSLNLPINLLNNKMINPHYSGPEISIIYQDDLIIAIDKPCSVHAHPHGYDESDNVLSFFRSKNIFTVLQTNQYEYDRGLLYRLDKGTSGVLIFAKNDELYESVRNNFNSIARKKIYQAIVCGKSPQDGTIDGYLKGVGRKGSIMKVVDQDDDGAMKAILNFKTLKYDNEKDLSLIEVELLTGVRHQIRAQLSSIGFPILGDVLYGGRIHERIWLHAYQYDIRCEKLNISICAEWISFV